MDLYCNCNMDVDLDVEIDYFTDSTKCECNKKDLCTQFNIELVKYAYELWTMS